MYALVLIAGLLNGQGAAVSATQIGVFANKAACSAAAKDASIEANTAPAAPLYFVCVKNGK